MIRMNARLIKNIILFLFLQFAFSNQMFAASNDVHFLTLADIHFDPFMACQQTRGRCPFILKLRQAPISQWNALLSANDKSLTVYRKDTNYQLFKNVLMNAGLIAQEQQVKFVIILGDFLGHNYRKQYIKYSNDQSRMGFQSFVKKTLEFMTQQIATTFKDIDVYTVVGNNDTYRRNYFHEPRGVFFHETANLWSPLIQSSHPRAIMQREFANAGYYAISISSASQLKLIVLNTVLFSYKIKDQNMLNAAQKELLWLHEQLRLAKQQKQHVLIAMHIPEGVDINLTSTLRLFRLMDLWRKNVEQQIQAELTLFAPEIVGIFAGHLHMDWFRVMQLKNNGQIPVFGIPSVSPIFGNNPSFKVYNYSAQDNKISVLQTQEYPLEKQKSWHT